MLSPRPTPTTGWLLALGRLLLLLLQVRPLPLLLARGADARATARVVDISARNRQDGAESRVRNARVAVIQRELAAARARTPAASAPAAPRRAADADAGNEPEPLGYADLVGAQGGLTALLLATREGLADTVLALLEGGADINQVSASDHTSPLLMAECSPAREWTRSQRD